jgi:hypothetical protein
VDKLRPHPVREMLPTIPSALEEDDSLFGSVARNGVLQPVLLASDGRVIDGMRRVEAAMRAGQDRIKAVRCLAMQELPSLVASVFAKRVLTVSARAYLAWPLVEPLLQAARDFHINCLKEGNSPVVTHVTTGKPPSRDEVLKQFGIGVHEMLAAEAAHKHLDSLDADEREDHRMAIERLLFVTRGSIRKWESAVFGMQAKRNDLNGIKPKQLVFDFAPVCSAARTLTRRLTKPGLWEDPASAAKAADILAEELRELPPMAKEAFWKALKKAEIDAATGE